VDALLKRDGPQSYLRHLSGDGRCPYASLYEETPCPWCEADENNEPKPG
jgi:hypothetical protein